MPPSTFSDTYELRGQLGSGGGGVVYRAWHKRLQMEVVIKELKAGTSVGLTTQRAEVDILKKLKHSHLPQVYDFVVDGERVYTVMEFIDGQSLAELLEQGQPFPQQLVLRWAGQLCDALAYLHSQKPPILHSDIKPANIMRTASGDVCLIDFNISLLLDKAGAVPVGRSHGYASPEQYGPASPEPPQAPVAQPEDNKTELLQEAALTDGNTELLRPGAPDFLPAPDDERTAQLHAWEPTPSNPMPAVAPRQWEDTAVFTRKLDVRSDIYSLGATLYHLLTGERPNADATKVKPLESFPVPLSESVRYIISRAMAPDPAQRFQTVESMRKAVRGVHRLDRRWKRLVVQRYVAAGLVVALFAASSLCVVAGNGRMRQEKEDRYAALVRDVESASPDGLDTAFAKAAALFPERIEAYHAKAVALAHAGEYETCRAFIQASLPALHIVEADRQSEAKLGDIYFIMGGCYFEAEDYSNAAVYYRSAVELNDTNPEYYRDYAIALARTDDIPGAERIMAKAQELHLSGDSLNLLRGEIAYAKGDDERAIDCFRQTIRTTDDEYIRYRAYRICDDAYKRQGNFLEQITLLEEARGRVEQHRLNEISERLAAAYLRGAESGAVDRDRYYQEALQLFSELQERGYNTFHIRQNLAILRQTIGDFTAAEQTLLELREDYPDDYRVPMRLAYLYADMQAQVANEQRDYTDTKEQFAEAWRLYEQHVQPGQADPEMLMLQDMMEQLRQGGW